MSAYSIIYPTSYPQPIAQGARNTALTGTEASEYRPGRPSAIRRFARPPQTFQFVFLMDYETYPGWRDWLVENDAWHPRGMSMSLPSFATTGGNQASAHDVRLMGPLRVLYRADGVVSVSVRARVTIGGDGRLELGGSFHSSRSPIIAGSPGSLSPGGPIIAGSPGALSSDNIIIAGAPANVI